MADYINREALVDTLTAKADMALGTPKEVFHAAAKMVNLLPAADVVEVVRCRDCEQWKRNSGFADSPNGHCFYHCIDTNGNDFCSYGERKEK